MEMMNLTNTSTVELTDPLSDMELAAVASVSRSPTPDFVSPGPYKATTVTWDVDPVDKSDEVRIPLKVIPVSLDDSTELSVLSEDEGALQRP
ncbi:hypothetical protein MTO96_009733 [Rhipicephalus appendiculatus]